MSIWLCYSFEALSDIESADPHSTIFTVVIAGIESSTTLLIVRIVNLVCFITPSHPHTHPFTPGLIEDPIVKPLSLRSNDATTTELVSCEADTTSDYFSASGGSTPSSFSRSQSLIGCELLCSTEDDEDHFSELSCDSEDEWEQLDRQLQLLEERRGSAPLLPKSTSWHRYVPSSSSGPLAKQFHPALQVGSKKISNCFSWFNYHTSWDSGVLLTCTTITFTIMQRK